MAKPVLIVLPVSGEINTRTLSSLNDLLKQIVLVSELNKIHMIATFRHMKNFIMLAFEYCYTNIKVSFNFFIRFVIFNSV